MVVCTTVVHKTNFTEMKETLIKTMAKSRITHIRQATAMTSSATIIRKNKMREKDSKRKNDQTIDDNTSDSSIWMTKKKKHRHRRPTKHATWISFNVACNIFYVWIFFIHSNLSRVRVCFFQPQLLLMRALGWSANP